MIALSWFFFILVTVTVIGIPAVTLGVVHRRGRRAGVSRHAALTTLVLSSLGVVVWLAILWWAASSGLTSRVTVLVPIAAATWTVGVLAWSRLPVVVRALRPSGEASALIAPQVLRVGGLAFLLAMVLGTLPWLFALPAGLGDIAVGIAAPSVMRRVARGEVRRGVWFNVLGLLDLVVAFTLGALTGLSAQTQLIPVSPTSAALTMVPLVLVITSAVPVAMALHIVDLRALHRLSAARGPASSTTAATASHPV